MLPSSIESQFHLYRKMTASWNQCDNLFPRADIDDYLPQFFRCYRCAHALAGGCFIFTTSAHRMRRRLIGSFCRHYYRSLLAIIAIALGQTINLQAADLFLPTVVDRLIQFKDSERFLLRDFHRDLVHYYGNDSWDFSSVFPINTPADCTYEAFCGAIVRIWNWLHVPPSLANRHFLDY